MNKIPSMTRAHYEYLAAFAPKMFDVLGTCTPPAMRRTVVERTMRAVAHHLKGTNPNFNYDKFMQRVQDLLDQKEA